jgi:hypothetical protein
LRLGSGERLEIAQERAVLLQEAAAEVLHSIQTPGKDPDRVLAVEPRP